jgi:hypothetical protein
VLPGNNLSRSFEIYVFPKNAWPKVVMTVFPRGNTNIPTSLPHIRTAKRLVGIPKDVGEMKR